VENNSIKDYSTPRNLKVLNIKRNPEARPINSTKGLLVNPMDGVV
jgi:hypothetical protein